MLVLNIRIGDDLIIGDAVVKVISRGKYNVRVGIEAPKNIRILRGEVARRLEDEKRVA